MTQAGPGLVLSEGVRMVKGSDEDFACASHFWESGLSSLCSTLLSTLGVSSAIETWPFSEARIRIKCSFLLKD